MIFLYCNFFICKYFIGAARLWTAQKQRLHPVFHCIFQHGSSWFGLKEILSYTDDNVLEFKPVSSINNGLIWKGDSISRQRFTVGRLCAVRRHEVQAWIGCRASTHRVLCSSSSFPLAPAKWAERWKGKHGFSCESHRCALSVTCVNHSLLAHLILSRKEDWGSPAHVGLWRDTRQHHPLNDSQSCVQPSYPLIMLSSQANPPL